jgi:hypothetical protein
MVRKIKREKAWKSQPSKTNLAFFQYCLWPFRLEYLKLEKSIRCKLNVFGFLTWRPINLPNFSRKKSSYERDMIFLRWHINLASKHVLWRNKSKVLLKASKPTSKSLFRQFSSSKSKVKAWRFYTRLFLLF